MLSGELHLIATRGPFGLQERRSRWRPGLSVRPHSGDRDPAGRGRARGCGHNPGPFRVLVIWQDSHLLTLPSPHLRNGGDKAGVSEVGRGNS